MLILCPKIPHLPDILGIIKIFHKKSFHQIYLFTKPQLYEKIQERVMIQFWESVVTGGWADGQSWIHMTLWQSKSTYDQINCGISLNWTPSTQVISLHFVESTHR